MAHTYDKGDVVRCTAVFSNVAGAGVDPTVVIFSTLDPAGNEVSYEYGVDPEVVKPEVGTYYIDVSIDQSSVWHVRCAGTGLNAAACESYFNVRTSRFV